MANIRANAVATVIISAALAAGSISATAQILEPGKQENRIVLAESSARFIEPSIAPRYANAISIPQTVIQAALEIIPLRALNVQTVSMSDSIGPFDITRVVLDVATISESVALTYNKVLSDSVTMTDLIGKMFVSNVDFDLSDPDVDPDPISVFDSDTKSVGKNLTDATAISETNVKDVTTSRAESLQTQDEIFTIAGKNLDNTVTASEEVVTNVATIKTDSVTAAESHEVEFTKGNISDAVTSSDLASLNAGLNKNSSVTAQDAVNSFDIGKNPSDLVDATDELAKDFIRPNVTDAAVVTDAAAKDFTRPDVEDSTDAIDTVTTSVDKSLTDAATSADTLVANAGKTLTDAATTADALTTSVDKTLVDSAEVADALAANTDKTLTDTTSILDTLTTNAGKTLTDTATTADTVAKAVQAVYADSATVSDEISLLLTLGQSSPLYDFAFIADDKYTYFPVPGTLNNHMIHQPLVNGEFVLTTDPNAGIVYTIRPESESYMFGGYGINENQFN